MGLRLLTTDSTDPGLPIVVTADDALTLAGVDVDHAVTPASLAAARAADQTAYDARYVNTTGDTVTGDLLVNDTLETNNFRCLTQAFFGGPDNWDVQTGSEIDQNGHLYSAAYVVNTPNQYLTRRGSTGTAGGASQPYAMFLRSASTATPVDTSLGSIMINTGVNGVTYNTTSDPRVKSTPPPTRGIDDAVDRVRQLGSTAWVGYPIDPSTGDQGDEPWDYLSSHDIEDVAPYAVTGDRDAVDDNGHPIYQQVDYSTLVPVLTAALSQAIDRVNVLETFNTELVSALQAVFDPANAATAASLSDLLPGTAP